MLWARGVGRSWIYGVFDYSKDPRLLQSVQPRFGIVRGVGGIRDVGYLLVMEEVPVRDADPEDRMLYRYVYACVQEGRMLRTGVVLLLHTRELADWERGN
jgi:hypothetical protein